MKKMSVIAAAVLLCAANATAQQKFPLAQYTVRSHDGIQRNLVEAAEKMPEEHYGFKPTPDVRPFSQVLMHAAISRFRTCSYISGQTNPRESEKEDQARSK